jgi:hypothetical protein
MPRTATPGTWEPSAAAVGAYATALATRYSGHFPDPSAPGQTLPAVWAFQVWNEPNLTDYLAPQWKGRTAEAPTLYRNMLNAAYRGIKSVDPAALVVTAGTAPFGDPEPGGQRIQPAAFWRDVLCVKLQGNRLVGEHCRTPAHFDVLAHHPYSVGAPSTHAINRDDVSIPDLGKLSAIVRVAERSGGALPRVRHPIWVTEVGYNTKPPNPYGVPVGTAARWLEQTLFLLWSQGVPVVTWNTIVDQAPEPSYSATSQSGIYFLNGALKPAVAAAFSFPLVASRKGSAVTVWGRSPGTGELSIQRYSGTRWTPIVNVKVNIGNTFLAHFIDIHKMTLRAVIGSAESGSWAVS